MIRWLGSAGQLIRRSVLPTQYRCFSQSNFDFSDEIDLEQQRSEPAVMNIQNQLAKIASLNIFEIRDLMELVNTHLVQFPGIEMIVIDQVKKLDMRGQLSAVELASVLGRSASTLPTFLTFELEHLLLKHLQQREEVFTFDGITQTLSFVEKSWHKKTFALLQEINKRFSKTDNLNVHQISNIMKILISIQMKISSPALSEMTEVMRERLMRCVLEPPELEKLVNDMSSLPRLDPGLAQMIVRAIEKRCTAFLNAEECLNFLQYLHYVRIVWPEKVPVHLMNNVLARLERNYTQKAISEDIHSRVLVLLASLQWRPANSLVQALSQYAPREKQSDLVQLALSFLSAAGSAKPPPLEHLLQCTFASDPLTAFRLVCTHPSSPHPVLTQLHQNLLQELLRPNSDSINLRNITKIEDIVTREPQLTKHYGALLPLIAKTLGTIQLEMYRSALPVLSWFVESHRDQALAIFREHYMKGKKAFANSPIYYRLCNIGRLDLYLKLLSQLGVPMQTTEAILLLNFYSPQIASEDLTRMVRLIEASTGDLIKASHIIYFGTLCEMIYAHPWTTLQLQSRISRELCEMDLDDFLQNLDFLNLYGSLDKTCLTPEAMTKRMGITLSLSKHARGFPLLAENYSEVVSNTIQSTSWTSPIIDIYKTHSRLIILKKFILLLRAGQDNERNLAQLRFNFRRRIVDAPVKTACQLLLPIARLESPHLSALMAECFQSILKKIRSLPVAEADLCIEALSLSLYIAVPKQDLQFLVDSVLAQWGRLSLQEKCEALSRFGEIGYQEPQPYIDCVNAALSSNETVLRYAPDVIQALHNAKVQAWGNKDILIDKYFALALANNAEKLNPTDFSKISIASINYNRWKLEFSKLVPHYSGEMSLLRRYILYCAVGIPIDFLVSMKEITLGLARHLPAVLKDVIKKDNLRFIDMAKGRFIYYHNYLPQYHTSLLCPPLMPYSDEVSGDIFLYSKLFKMKENKRAVFVPKNLETEEKAKNWLYSILD